MSPALTFGRRAFAHVHHLAGEIGPRPAGSPAEAAAFRYVERCLRGWGYAPAASPVVFAPAPALTWVYISGGLALALGGAFLEIYYPSVQPVLSSTITLPSGSYPHPSGYIRDYAFAANFEAIIPAPEPSSFALLGLGILGLRAIRRKQNANCEC